MKIIGLCGYARVGKDTAWKNMPGWTRYAFADALKRDLAHLLDLVGCDLNNPEHKEAARPLLVAWGQVARAFKPEYWIDRLFERMQGEQIVITDVRYRNEVQAIRDRGGKVIRIDRYGYGPANEEERMSFQIIDGMMPALPRVYNNGSREELGRRVLEAARW